MLMGSKIGSYCLMPLWFVDLRTTPELYLRHLIERENFERLQVVDDMISYWRRTFGDDPMRAAGFGFRDAVIVELLKERNVLPSFVCSGIDSIVFAMMSELYGAAVDVATKLRNGGQSVDVMVESQKTKWGFQARQSSCCQILCHCSSR